ncbi:MAG: HNH endonuclease [Pyrinomonadaceae bacterium]
MNAGGRCQSCNTRLERGWHADHHIPYSKGGATALTNGRAKCRTCNLKDGNRMPDKEGKK